MEDGVSGVREGSGGGSGGIGGGRLPTLTINRTISTKGFLPIFEKEGRGGGIRNGKKKKRGGKKPYIAF